LEQNLEKKHFKLTLESANLEVKIKFLALNNEEEPNRLRMKLIKKKGDLSKWYEIFQDM